MSFTLLNLIYHKSCSKALTGRPKFVFHILICATEGGGVSGAAGKTFFPGKMKTCAKKNGFLCGWETVSGFLFLSLLELPRIVVSSPESADPSPPSGRGSKHPAHSPADGTFLRERRTNSQSIDLAGADPVPAILSIGHIAQRGTIIGVKC